MARAGLRGGPLASGIDADRFVAVACICLRFARPGGRCHNEMGGLSGDAIEPYRRGQFLNVRRSCSRHGDAGHERPRVLPTHWLGIA